MIQNATRHHPRTRAHEADAGHRARPDRGGADAAHPVCDCGGALTRCPGCGEERCIRCARAAQAWSTTL